MGQVKEINIKNQAFYFFNDMIDIKNFHSNLLKIDKKLHKHIDFYYIGYITIKKFLDCENIHSVNPLYLIIHSVMEYFKERNGKKYLILDSTDKCEEVWSGIRSEIKTMVEKNGFMKKINDLPFNKPPKYPTLTIIIRWVFQEGEKLYPQIYLDESLYVL